MTKFLIDTFSKTTAALSAGEKALNALGIPYEKLNDGRGTLRVTATIQLQGQGLTELPDLSCVELEGSFYCMNNALTSLKGAPHYIRNGFWCDNNALTSLEGAPQHVGLNFMCNDNPLQSLEGAPATFQKIISDFGTFHNWDEVPEEVRLSPQTREKLARQAEEDFRQRLRAATTVPKDTDISRHIPRLDLHRRKKL